MDVRNEIIENLQKQKHVEKVLSVFVDSRNQRRMDTDGTFLTEADLKILTRTENVWGNKTFRNKSFKSCNLHETIQVFNRRMTREEYLYHRNETGWR